MNKEVKRIELTLRGLTFPSNLQNRKANFRLVVSLRFYDKDGHLKTENGVVPGLDTFWECDTGESDRYNYVRGSNGTVDMRKVQVWDKLILSVLEVTSTQLYSPLLT